MLPKEYRLTKSQEIKRVYFEGQRNKKGVFRINYKKNNEKCPRFAFVVPNKVAKQATKRNRIKRQLRSIISLNLDIFTKNFDIIVLVGPGTVKKGYNELERELIFTLKYLHLAEK